jgi:DNA-binding response OmpR family regulator
MAKILLVEDDINLREIFDMRLQAEGYQTVTASDGEEALTVAMKEKPDLIIADIMMPKLSGFEMLETLKASPEMKDVKVIMMTALGQAEDRARGEKLGVIKYLVKSQVTLEDFVRVVRDVVVPSSTTGQSNDPANTNVQNNNLSQQTIKGNNMQDDQSTNPVPADANPISGAPADSSAPVVPTADSGAPADAMAALPADPVTDAGSAPVVAQLQRATHQKAQLLL